jgi:hypothetical protein
MMTCTDFVSRGTATRNVIRRSAETSGERRIDCAAAIAEGAATCRVVAIGRVAGALVAVITAAAMGRTVAAVGCGGCCGFTGALGEHAKVKTPAVARTTAGTLNRMRMVMGDRLY